MKQMKLPAQMIIPYDYEAPDVPEIGEDFASCYI